MILYILKNNIKNEKVNLLVDLKCIMIIIVPICYFINMVIIMIWSVYININKIQL